MNSKKTKRPLLSRSHRLFHWLSYHLILLTPLLIALTLLPASVPLSETLSSAIPHLTARARSTATVKKPPSYASFSHKPPCQKPVFAKKTAFMRDTASYVVDEANLLSKSELEALNAQYSQVSQKYQVDILAITIRQPNINRTRYIEDYYDSGLENHTLLKDAVILLLNMDSDSRGIAIQSYGRCQLSVSSQRIEEMLDVITPMLTDENYAEALKQYGKGCAYCFQHETGTEFSLFKTAYADITKKSERRFFIKRTLINLLIALAAAAAIVFLMAYQKGQRAATCQRTYMDAAHSRILGSYDHYTHTTATKHPKPKEPPKSSSGSGDGVSPGGRSHSGGNRSF